MKEIIANPELVAFCGLYCGACNAYLRDRCPGCHENAKATWCRVRSCCLNAGYSSCVECKEFSVPKERKKFNNVFSRVIGMVLRSDRAACIAQIKAIGLERHAEDMASKRRRTIGAP